MGVHDETLICVNPEEAIICAATTTGNVGKDKNDRRKEPSSSRTKSTTHSRHSYYYDGIKIEPYKEFVAAIFAAGGLMGNSFSSLVISMFCSHTCYLTFLVPGCLKRDKTLIRLGVNAGILILLAGISVGMIHGIWIMWWKPDEAPGFTLQKWPTDEMMSRVKCLTIEDLIDGSTYGLFMVLLTLIDYALGDVICQNIFERIVTMPLVIAVVNCGIFWGMSIFVSLNEMVRQQHLNFPCDQEVFSKDNYWMGHNNRTVLYCTNTVKEFAAMGTVCLVRSLLFIILTFLIGNTFRLIKGFAECCLRKNTLTKQDITNIQKV